MALVIVFATARELTRANRLLKLEWLSLVCVLRFSQQHSFRLSSIAI